MNKARNNRQAADIVRAGLAVFNLADRKGWTPERELLAFLASDRVEELLAEKSSPIGQAAHRLKLLQIEAEQRAATMYYLRTGEVKGLAAQDDQRGGFLLAPGFRDELITSQETASAMRRICRSLSIDTDALHVPEQQRQLDSAEWTTELTIDDVDASHPFGAHKFRPLPLTKFVKVSKTLLRRGGRFADEVIMQAIAEALAVPIELATIRGNGASRPVGLLETPDLPTTTTTTPGALTITDVKRWIGGLAGRWHARATALMHTDTYAAMLQLDTNGALFQNGLLLGKYPIELSDQFPSAGDNPAALTSATTIAVFGDFSRYWIVDGFMAVQVLMELFAETNGIGYIARAEVDGGVVTPAAFNALVVS